MPVNISCPACNNRGEMPDDTSPTATLSCQACGVRFSLWAAVTPAAPALPAEDALAVWVGGAADRQPGNKASAVLALQEKALARDRARLDARARELDAREVALSAERERVRDEVATLSAARQRDAAAIADLREQLARAVERYTAAAEQAAGQAETIERMMAAGQRLIRQRDALRVKLRLADRPPAVRRAAAPPAK